MNKEYPIQYRSILQSGDEPTVTGNKFATYVVNETFYYKTSAGTYTISSGAAGNHAEIQINSGGSFQASPYFKYEFGSGVPGGITFGTRISGSVVGENSFSAGYNSASNTYASAFGSYCQSRIPHTTSQAFPIHKFPIT